MKNKEDMTMGDLVKLMGGNKPSKREPKPPMDYSIRDVAESLYQSMTDHDVGWANWMETVHMTGVSVVYFTMLGYNTTDKKFKITIEEA